MELNQLNCQKSNWMSNFTSFEWFEDWWWCLMSNKVLWLYSVFAFVFVFFYFPIIIILLIEINGAMVSVNRFTFVHSLRTLLLITIATNHVFFHLGNCYFRHSFSLIFIISSWFIFVVTLFFLGAFFHFGISFFQSSNHGVACNWMGKGHIVWFVHVLSWTKSNSLSV